MSPVERWPVFGAARRGSAISIGLGLGGLALTALRASSEARLALGSYLVAFAYWLGLSLGALLLLMIFQASHARWMVVIRRPIEVLAATVVIFPILFLPIALGLARLYPWAAPTTGLDHEVLDLLRHRAAYLNPAFFYLRAGAYFAIWVTVSQLLHRWSLRQDRTGAPAFTEYSWRLGAGALPVVGLALTFAAVDWLMSLDVHWYSTIWGVYYFAGSFVGAIALVILLSAALASTASLQGALGAAHWLSLGNLLLAFTCFWAYIAYSQYLLVWIGNLPDTVPWLALRQNPEWRWIGWTLILGHFAAPLTLLLSRSVKMSPPLLTAVALLVLIVHYLDLYWVVMPAVQPERVRFDWSNLTALVGIGGFTVAAGLSLLRGRHVLPVRDPFLTDSLAYSRTL